MPHHRYPDLNYSAYCLSHVVSAFHLNGVTAGLFHHLSAICYCLLHSNLITHECHISYNYGISYSTFHYPRVVDHLFERNRQSCFVSLNHVAKRISHKYNFNSGLVKKFCGEKIICRKHCDLLFSLLHFREDLCGDVRTFSFL